MSKKKKSKNPIKGRKLGQKELKSQVVKLFKRFPKQRMNPRQVIKKLKIDNNSPSVIHAMETLVKDGKLLHVTDNKYRLNKYAVSDVKVKTHEGIVDMTRNGSAFVACDDLAQDVFIPARALNTAINGDRVRVVVTRSPRGRRPEGVVSEVIERATEHFIGTIRLSKNYAFVIPDADMQMDIYVDNRNTLKAKEGDKVIVKVIQWNTGTGKSPVGKVTSVLGEEGSSDIVMKSILINNGFELEFPQQVLEESAALSLELDEEELARRRDMREVTTFTIDPDTAKDFDDALSIRYLDAGLLEIGIHIADVTHYVKPDTALDKEAYKRSTSVYLVDRVLPMLPEELSNGLCSLRPNEDKFTFSAVFTFDKDDKIVDRWFGKTITHSDRRFTYEEAQEIIETGKGDFAAELKVMNRIAYVLRKQKFKNGAIAFEAEEVKFKLDEEGTPLSVYVKERKDAHKLVEDFMLLANREVATFIDKKGKKETKEIPFVYRIHDSPDPAKLLDFALFAKGIGLNMDVSNPKAISKAFNNLAEQARKNPEYKILEPMAIRTMAKAVYSTDNIGHYGLAFTNYAHFTSPIRRYADVLVHRLLELNLNESHRTDKEDLEMGCKHISAQERKAMSAERESVKYKQVEFIKDQVGRTFEGVITGIIDRGFFVEIIENRWNGQVRFFIRTLCYLGWTYENQRYIFPK